VGKGRFIICHLSLVIAISHLPKERTSRGKRALFLPEMTNEKWQMANGKSVRGLNEKQ
jgi:hypothetical protein